MNMSKNQYVDSVMRVLGKCSNQVTLDDLEELQILLESEWEREMDKTYLSQRMLMHLQAG